MLSALLAVVGPMDSRDVGFYGVVFLFLYIYICCLARRVSFFVTSRCCGNIYWYQVTPKVHNSLLSRATSIYVPLLQCALNEEWKK